MRDGDRLHLTKKCHLSIRCNRKKLTKPAPPRVLKLLVAAKVQQITGEVTAINTNAMTMTVTKKMRSKVLDVVVTVNDETKIMIGKGKRTFADVKAGDKVIIKYREVDGKNVTQSIAIKPSSFRIYREENGDKG